MKDMNYYLAIDIGASSGRHIIGWRENNEIKMDEVYRFPNKIKMQNQHLVWDMKELYENVEKGIKVALEKYKNLKSLSIDTWGVDYVLLSNEEEISPCFAYRDSRTEEVIEEVHRKIPFKELYQRTGIQYQPFNTIYQLYDDFKQGRLSFATDFLMIPEYLNYKLTGVKLHEYTNATTTGLVNAKAKEYDEQIIKKLGLPKKIFKKLYFPGTSVGMLKPDVASLVGGQVEVILCASHDTASAVEGIKMNKNSPYISSGTWSLLGLKVPNAITNEDSRIANYSNEGGVGYIRYQKNIMGMWVVNRLKEELCPNKSFSQIVLEAKESSFKDYVDINDSSFLAPESMKKAFDDWLIKKKAFCVWPLKEADYFCSALISLAVSYKNALEELRKNSKTSFDTLYIVGGGAKNNLLNDLTTRICNLKVKALPIEATALGNLKIQIERGKNNV